MTGCEELPFVVVRDADLGLADQMVSGIKQAISCGHWSVGDRLPSLNEFAKLAKTSRRIPKTAMQRLLQEGWVASLPRKGYIVANPNIPMWKGRVLVVFVSDGNTQVGGALYLRDVLERNRYFVQLVFVRCAADGAFDLLPLKTALLGKFDLAFCHRPVREIADSFAEARVPYVLGCARTRTEYLPRDEYYRGCICSDDGFFADVIAAIRKSGVRRVAFVDFHDVFDRYAARLKSAGFAVEVIHTPVDAAVVTPARVRDGAARFFAARYGAQGGRLPDAFLFIDDYVADGALCALARLGVRIPRDVKVVTMYNDDVGLAYQADFSRIAVDLVAMADVTAGYLLDLLAGKRPPVPKTSFRYVSGETL